MVVDGRCGEPEPPTERHRHAPGLADRLVGDSVGPGREVLSEPLRTPRRHRPSGVDEAVTPFHEREIGIPGIVEPVGNSTFDVDFGHRHRVPLRRLGQANYDPADGSQEENGERDQADRGRS